MQGELAEDKNKSKSERSLMIANHLWTLGFNTLLIYFLKLHSQKQVLGVDLFQGLQFAGVPSDLTCGLYWPVCRLAWRLQGGKLAKGNSYALTIHPSVFLSSLTSVH